MPFNSATASVAGKKGGSFRKDPTSIRNKQLTVTVTQDEYDTITSKASLLGVSKANFIVSACKAFSVVYDKNEQLNVTVSGASEIPSLEDNLDQIFANLPGEMVLESKSGFIGSESHSPAGFIGSESCGSVPTTKPVVSLPDSDDTEVGLCSQQ